MAEAVVRVIEATKRYGARVALQGVSLALYPGELLALLGPNGAGKSTLVQLLPGLRRPDAGQVWLFGGSPQDAHNRMHLGVTPQQTDLPPTLRVAEVLELVRTHFPRPAPTAELAERFGLEGLLKRQCGGLSGGEKRGVALALAFAGNPRLVLDEPTTGLDVETRRGLWAVLQDYRQAGGLGSSPPTTWKRPRR
ncbi:MAG: ABC transporter ATP-binding protein [Meiothermus sp.]|uniref:ABC transporter ATP-binding protein n=1 Tax=Meiothermus sp. TaxID=1955249 RepID=UPI0025F42F0A|nr:ABC transporter ATP-binding protein [Meiothermus sp.]MCS7057313.1 ABC transporter ATP-binding protein [Meiothermus sp.]